MIVTASLTAVLGIIVVVLYRFGRLRILPSLTVGAFGFSLATTGAAPTIQAFLGGAVHLLASIRF
ncbi:hypothetical protein ACIRVF_38815 [Kitasatospora sp. NPDC101157]|uniref:hypothetical protein n=1 Tax=Kitasatospora sp. NPDC101157 TaxID=3364098 RepID=UPI00380E13DE